MLAAARLLLLLLALASAGALLLRLPRPDCGAVEEVLGLPSELCLALTSTLAGLEQVSWPLRHLAALKHSLSNAPLCSALELPAKEGEELVQQAHGCLVLLASEVLRFSKMAADGEMQQFAVTIIQLVKKEVPGMELHWRQFWETPYIKKWPLKEHNAGSRPHPLREGWWHSQHPAVRAAILVLKNTFSKAVNEFKKVMAALKRIAEPNLNFNTERWGVGTIQLWTAGEYAPHKGSALEGWHWKACRLLPSVCEAFRELMDLRGTGPALLPGQKLLQLSLQVMTPSGYQLLHSTEERVLIQQCLSGCDEAWVVVGDEKRFFSVPFGILAFDGVLDHASGNNGTESCWTINLILSHPGQEWLESGGFDEENFMELRPADLDAARDLHFGTSASLGLRRLRWLADGFNCRAGRDTFPRSSKEDEEVWRLLMQNTNLAFAETNWEEAFVQLAIPGYMEERVVLPKAAAQGSITACKQMRHLATMSLHEAQQWRASLPPVSGEDSGQFVPLLLWGPGQELEVEQRAEEMTGKLMRYRLQRLLRAWQEDLRPTRWKQLVLEEMVLLLESFFILHLLNSYVSLLGTADFFQPLPPAYFFDFFADRVGIVLAALGDVAKQPHRLLVEVGVYNGTFALAFVSNSPMKYIGVDPYYSERGSFQDNATFATAMFFSVRKRLGEAAPGRARLHRMSSQEAARLTLPTASGLADAVYIDGHHELVDVLEDLRLWWPRLAPGGRLFGHDFIAPLTSVVAAVALFCAEVHCPRVNLGLDSMFWIEKSI